MGKKNSITPATAPHAAAQQDSAESRELMLCEQQSLPSGGGQSEAAPPMLRMEDVTPELLASLNLGSDYVARVCSLCGNLSCSLGTVSRAS